MIAEFQVSVHIDILNDVLTRWAEWQMMLRQIVVEDVHEGRPMQITSMVQNHGSIPLFGSQESSRLNLKPDIICRFK